MANITTQKLGGTGNQLAKGNIEVVGFSRVFDIEKAVDDGLTSGDNITLVTLPAGTWFFGLDAEITEELDLGTSPQIDIGTTEADPDEYVDGQSDTAVGRFSAYVSAAETPTVLTADTTFYMQVAGSAPASGKVAVTILAAMPVDRATELAGPRVYPNQ